MEFLTPELIENPYPHYQLWRDEYPIWWDEVSNSWILSTEHPHAEKFGVSGGGNSTVTSTDDETSKIVRHDLPSGCYSHWCLF